MRQVDFIVLHCTGGPQGQTVKAILAYWKSMGWKSVGYHRLIEADGTVHELAPYEAITNGVAGHNSRAIHNAYVGGVDASGRPTDNRTPAQLAAMERLVREQHALFPRAVIQGHRDFSPDKNRNGVIEPSEWVKACPSFSVKAWLEEIGFRTTLPQTFARTTTRVNIRAGAGTNFPTVAPALANGTSVQVLGVANGWTYVQPKGSGITGWVSSEFLRS